MIIKAVSFDPALANFGIARVTINTDFNNIQIDDLSLVRTDKRTGKTIRQNSDDLRRAKELRHAMNVACEGRQIAFAEIPTGAQSARAMFSFGLSIGVLASCPLEIIQVQPFETKLAAVGTKTASKEEMIEWATEKYPDADWIRARGKITAANEHLADAIAVAHAGIKTDQFKALLPVWASLQKQAA